MPNLCQNARNMPDLCQKVRKAKNMPYFDRKGQSWHDGRKWDFFRMPNLCQIMPNLCQIHAKLCQIHARRSGKPRTCPISTGRGRVGIMGANGTISQCQGHANFMPKCHIHARFMPEGQGQKHAIFRQERAELA